jgi:hypothetical protein
MNTMKTRLTSQTSRAGLALVVISFLLSLVPFQGKNLTTSKERTTAQTEVVATNKFKQRKSFAVSFFANQKSSLKNIPFQLAEIHSLQVNIGIKNLARNFIPVRRQTLTKTVFISETEDHIIA